jgi:hypothetical protein
LNHQTWKQILALQSLAPWPLNLSES